MPHSLVRVLALLLLPVLAACTGSTTHRAGPTVIDTAPSPSPTPSLSEGQKAANDTVIKYRALIDQLRQQYKPDSTQLLDVARDDAYDKWRRVLQDDFVAGYHQTGAASLTIESTDFGHTARQWLVAGCLDVTQLDIVDKSGKTTLERPGGINHIVYAVDQDATSLRWYVMTETFDGATC